MYSTTYSAVIVNLLVTVLPLLGITVGSEAITTTIQTLVAVATGLWILRKRFQVGDISAIGVKK